jgi:putative ABC transport system permease protein
MGGAFICLYPVPKNRLGIRIKEGSESATLDYIKEKWSTIAPGTPLSYTFLEEDIEELYSADRGQQSLLAFLALITILISGLGLLGITNQSMAARTKEVTLRKVFGAEKKQVITILYKDIVYLIGVAIILATPLTIWLYRRWVQNFAFQVNIKVIYFIIADLAILIFALALSGYHGIQVMNSKPVDKLRYE